MINEFKPERSTEENVVVPLLKATCKDMFGLSGPGACFLRKWQKGEGTVCCRYLKVFIFSHLGERCYITATQKSQHWLIARRVGFGEEKFYINSWTITDRLDQRQWWRPLGTGQYLTWLLETIRPSFETRMICPHSEHHYLYWMFCDKKIQGSRNAQILGKCVNV